MPIGMIDSCSLRFCLAHSRLACHIFIIFVAEDRRQSFSSAGAAYAPLEESKVVSSHPLMVNPRQVVRALVFALLLSLFAAASASLACGQQFTLTVSSPLSPSAVAPGGASIATLDLAAVGGFNSAVSFGTIPCSVTPVQAAGTPTCMVSPDSATPPAQAFLTVSTAGNTPPGLYTITVTGTSGASSQAVTLNLNVVNVTQDYTLSVSPNTATPPSVPAGNIATAVVTVTPIANYTGTVTLACLSITPVVQAEPYCSFAATSGSGSLPPGTVHVGAGAPSTATLTITTLGPIPGPVGALNRRIFFALWLLVPGVALVGVGATRTRGRNFLGAVFLAVIAGGLLLMPACGSTPRTNSPNGEITPKNTYTFTLTGADQNGAAPSNAVSSPATVTLAVN